MIYLFFILLILCSFVLFAMAIKGVEYYITATQVADEKPEGTKALKLLIWACFVGIIILATCASYRMSITDSDAHSNKAVLRTQDFKAHN